LLKLKFHHEARGVGQVSNLPHTTVAIFFVYFVASRSPFLAGQKSEDPAPS
jgi:hypothetical protein